MNFPRPVTLVLRDKLLAMVMAVNVGSRQSLFPRVIMTAHNDQLPVDLIAQNCDDEVKLVSDSAVQLYVFEIYCTSTSIFHELP